MFNQLINMEQWRTLKFRSHKAPVLIVKHSNTSSESSAVLQQIINAQQQKIIAQPINLVITQENREIVNNIERELAIEAISPQIIVMLAGKAIYSTHDADIDSLKIAEALKQ